MRFQTDLATGGKTIDEMIDLHAEYLKAMEVACLTPPAQKSLKVLRETMLEVLDLGIKFGWMMSNVKQLDSEGLVKLTRMVRKHVDLLITGLKGVARVSGSTHEASVLFELLAARLESCSFKT